MWYYWLLNLFDFFEWFFNYLFGTRDKQESLNPISAMVFTGDFVLVVINVSSLRIRMYFIAWLDTFYDDT